MLNDLFAKLIWVSGKKIVPRFVPHSVFLPLVNFVLFFPKRGAKNPRTPLFAGVAVIFINIQQVEEEY